MRKSAAIVKACRTEDFMKRKIGLLLSVCMFIQMFMFFGCLPHGIETEVFAENVMSKEQSVLNRLKIVEADETTDATSAVSRAEFAVYAANMIKLDTSSAERYYTDVPTDYWAVGSINALVDAGIITGTSSNTFEPDRAIRYDEACKILVTIAGYRPFVEKGGTLASYQAMAKRIDIGITPVNSEALSLEEVLEMIYNAMSIPMGSVTGYIDGHMKYEIVEEKTIFTTFWNVYIDEGFLSDINGKSTSNRDVSENNRAMIKNEVYSVDEGLNIEYCFARQVEYLYVKEKEKAEDLVIYAEPKYNDDVLVIESKDIVGFNSETNTIEYILSNKNSNTRAKKISKGAVVICNGRIAKGSLKEKIDEFLSGDKKGKLTVIYSISGAGDYVIIDSVKTYIMEAYDSENKIIYDKFDNAPLDLENYQIVNWKKSTMGEAGEPAEFPLPVGVMTSDDGYLADIIIYDEVKEDKLNARYREKDKIKFGEAVYKIDSYALSCQGATLILGESYEVIFDIFGEAVYFSQISNQFTYGFLRRAIVSKKGFSNKCMARFYLSDGTFAEYKFADKVCLDEITYKVSDYQKFFGAFPGVNTVTNDKLVIEPQLIRFMLNSENEINKIDTYKFNELNEDPKSTLRMDTNGYEPLYYSEDAKKFDTKYVTDSKSTLFFFVPDYDINGDVIYMGEPVSDDIKYYNTSKDLHRNGEINTAVYYLGTDSAVPAAIVSKQDKTDLLSGRIYMFDKIIESYDEERGVVKELVGWYNGGKTQLILDDEATEAAGMLTKGDLYRVYTNTDGKLVYGIYKVYDVEADLWENQSSPTMQPGKEEWAEKIKDSWWYYASYGVASWKDERSQIIKMYPYDKDGAYISSAYTMEKTRHGVIEDISKTGDLAINVYELVRNSKYEIRNGSAGDVKTYKRFGESCSRMIVNFDRGRGVQIFLYNLSE